MDETKNVDKKKERTLAFGVRLKAHRQGAKMTQEQLAEFVAKSTETISKMERGLIYPGVDMLILLADRLETTLDNLVGTHMALDTSKKQVALLAEASSILSGMSEEKLNVAVIQLKALKSLS